VYVTFFEHNISIWIAYGGVILVLIGIDEIIKIFQAKHISIQFRGADYMATQRLLEGK